MNREGSREHWASLHALIGRYAVAASNAESMMFRVLLELERQAGLPARGKAPGWSGIVAALRSVVVGHQHEDRVLELLRGAERRAKTRNDLVHTAWFSAAADQYLGRRHFSFGSGGSAIVAQGRVDLEQSLATMERYESDLEAFAFELSG